MARREYSEETKAAVMAALLTGQSVNAVAREYNIPKATVSSWKSRVVEPALREAVAGGATQKNDIGGLITAYVEEGLITLRKQAEFFRNEAWLLDQDASSVAVLHGVLMDKEMRLLEMLSRAAND